MIVLTSGLQRWQQKRPEQGSHCQRSLPLYKKFAPILDRGTFADSEGSYIHGGGTTNGTAVVASNNRWDLIDAT